MHGATDLGKLRRVNEDSFGLFPGSRTMVVCDGMGGHAAGEVASHSAVETMETFLSRDTATAATPSLPADTPVLSADAAELVWAIRLANRRVYMTAQAQQQMMGMGTTLVAARFTNGVVTIGHVGDSRAYLFSDGKLQAVTTDHSLVAELLLRQEITEEQARTFTERNIITRALGTRPSVAVDINILPAVPGDWYLLCSDGLCGVIEDDAIAALLAQHADDPTGAINALIAGANNAGGPDNITAAIAIVAEADAAVEVKRLTETVSESTPEEGDTELDLLEQLFPSTAPPKSSFDDTSTDKIQINLIDPPPDPQ
jgi:protein phosphatase